MPKVSVIVPTHNVGKYIRECLNSLVNQTLEDIEIICIDDGSTDNTLEILNEFSKKDKRIKIIHKKNVGYGSKINIGIDVAASDFIGILESDDCTEKNMYSDLYNLAIKNDCDIVKSNYYLYYSCPFQLIKSQIIDPKDSFKVTNLEETPIILDYPPSIWSGIYKKEFLVKNNIKLLETAGASYQDVGFYYKTMMQAKRVLLTDSAYIHYRQDNENSSVKSKKKVYCVNNEFDEIHRYIKENPSIEKFKSHVIVNQLKAYNYNLHRIDECFKKHFIERTAKEFNEFLKNGELKEDFYSQIRSRRKFELLINNPHMYYYKLLLKKIRKNIIQIKISKKKTKIRLFGINIIGEDRD